MIQTLNQTVESLVMDIQEGKLLLPEMQRRYVWKSVQVRDLFDSLYHQYPSGQLLVWETNELPSGTRQTSLQGVQAIHHSPRLLLDGQQRLTSLAAIMLGKSFADHNGAKSIDIVFNIFTEKFEVAGIRHTIQNNWISLTRFFKEGATSVLLELGLDFKTPETKVVLERLNRLDNIKKYPYYINVLVHLSYAEVTHIFVRTNSGGTKLGNADLALAQVSSSWHGVTNKFEEYQNEFKTRSWGLELDHGLLLRAIVVLLTGQSHFSRVFRSNQPAVKVEDIEVAWERAKKALDRVVSFLVNNCLIDHLEMLPTHNILMPLVAFFDRYGDHMTAIQARDLQRWVYMALIWTRYSSSSETAMDQDIAALSNEQPVQAMIQNIENAVGHRRSITEQELQDQRKNSPYMLMAYVLARQAKAQDWFNGLVIGNAPQDYYLHHIFPKSLLGQHYDLRKDSKITDQVANLVFLTDPLSRSAANRPPAGYLPLIDQQRLNEQYIPLQTNLWEIDQFEDFVRHRREMLASAINQFLSSLTEDKQVWATAPAGILEKRISALEIQLRKIVAQRLTEARGDSAWDNLVSPGIRKSVASHIAKQETSQPFTKGHHESLQAKLGFCLYSNLFSIISDNMTLFEDIFGTGPNLDTHQKFVITARNKFAHRNQTADVDLAAAEASLLWFEQCLNHVDIEDEADETVAVV